MPWGTTLSCYTSPHAPYGCVRCGKAPDEWLLYFTPYDVNYRRQTLTEYNGTQIFLSFGIASIAFRCVPSEKAHYTTQQYKFVP
uniref:Uncharacterized protein n=1 Tax=Romanomermis culicivorax TaxID=13658 RepID=A0A915KFL3_ROMCU